MDTYWVKGIRIEIGECYGFIYYSHKTFIVYTDRGRDQLERLTLSFILDNPLNVEEYYGEYEVTVKVG